MIKLDNGAICTCDIEGGCAYHGTGEAGIYRKSFEHASANYNAEKARADQAEHAVACAVRQIKDVQDLKVEVESLRRKLEAARVAIRALVTMAED